MTPRILILIQRFHPIVGGMERQAQLVLRHLRHAGWPIEVWTRKPTPNLPDSAEVDGIPILRFGQGHETASSIYHALWQQTWALWKKRHTYDLIHVYGSGHLAVLAALMGRLAGKPVLVRPATYSDVSRYIDPSTTSATRLGRLYRILDIFQLKRIILKWVKGWVSLTDEITAELESLNLAPIYKIPNGVDEEHYHPIVQTQKQMLRQQYQLPQEAVIFVFVGRFIHRKGLQELLEAWAQVVVSSNHNLHLILVGSGEAQKDSIEAQIAPLIASQPTITHVGLADPTPFYQLADCFVLPSHREGLPNVLLEAMACGLACLATTIGGVTAIVNHAENSWLVPPQNAPALTEAIHYLADNATVRQALGAKARETILKNHSIGHSVAQYEALYATWGARNHHE